MNQLNEERRRNATALDPNSQETRDQWHATQVTNHERLLLFSDNLTTLMFIVVCDLSETQKGDLPSSLSLQGNECHCFTFAGYIDERPCFSTWDDREYAWAVQAVERSPSEEKKKQKGKGKGGFKGTGRVFLGEEQAQDPEWWSQEDCARWSKRKRGEKGFSKRKNQLSENGFPALTDQKRMQAMITAGTKTEAKNEKERASKVLIFSLEFHFSL